MDRMQIEIAIAACLGGIALGALSAFLAGAGARVRATVAEARRCDLQALLAAAEAETRAARERAAAAETACGVAEERVAALHAQIAAWETARAQFLEVTRAGVLETAQSLSTKLLEDHKRETGAARAEAEALVKTTAEGLKQEVKGLEAGVAALKGQVAESARTVDTVWRALTSPGGAGYYAEIGLANTLVSFGLVERRDFVLQETVYGEEAGTRLRPDAIVFLPHDSVLVIDAKASKHFIEIARAEAEGLDPAAAAEGLRRTMGQHLRDLRQRDYANAVSSGIKRMRGTSASARTLTVMYLPNEAALERLGQLDPGFIQEAAKAGIVPAGPAGLAAIVGFAAGEIGMMRQIENQEAIIRGAERLVESLSVMLGHAATVGKGIRQAADGYVKLTQNVNGRLLPRARDLQHLGLRPPKPIPGNLGAYQVLDLGTEPAIELEPGDELALPGPE